VADRAHAGDGEAELHGGAVFARGRATAAVPRSTQPTASRTARSVISVRVESARADVAAQTRPVLLEEADGAEESLRRTRRRYTACRRCGRGRRAAARTCSSTSPHTGWPRWARDGQHQKPSGVTATGTVWGLPAPPPASPSSSAASIRRSLRDEALIHIRLLGQEEPKRAIARPQTL
jgi:hypothetical protein